VRASDVPRNCKVLGKLPDAVRVARDRSHDPLRSGPHPAARVEPSSNAPRHGSNSQPVNFSAHIEDAELVIQVANLEPPILPESLAGIFEPFWRNSPLHGTHAAG